MSASSLIDSGQLEAIKKLDLTIRRTNEEVREAEEAGNPMITAVAMARGMSAIREGMQPLMSSLMQLMGSPLGFRTDRDSTDKKYTAEQVRDALIVGLMRGLRVVGNEINIIGGNCYATKEGMRRLVREIPGVANLRIQFGVPTLREGGALVPADVSWTFNGRRDSLDCHVRKEGEAEIDRRIPVRVNSGMGADAIIGKAESKIYRRIHMMLTGTDQAVVEDGDSLDVHTAGEPVATAAPPAHTLEELLNGIEAAEKQGDAIGLYNHWQDNGWLAGWSDEQKDIAGQAANQKEQSFMPQRGHRGNKQQQELVK